MLLVYRIEGALSRFVIPSSVCTILRNLAFVHHCYADRRRMRTSRIRKGMIVKTIVPRLCMDMHRYKRVLK